MAGKIDTWIKLGRCSQGTALQSSTRLLESTNLPFDAGGRSVSVMGIKAVGNGHE